MCYRTIVPDSYYNARTDKFIIIILKKSFSTTFKAVLAYLTFRGKM